MTEIEKGAFLKLFNRGGYVLDFSTGDFDIFTKVSVGVPLCQKYELSKGKSLTAFCEEASPEDVVKLFSDLLEHYEINCRDSYGEDKNTALYEKCRGIMFIVHNEYSVELSKELIQFLIYHEIGHILNIPNLTKKETSIEVEVLADLKAIKILQWDMMMIINVFNEWFNAKNYLK